MTLNRFQLFIENEKLFKPTERVLLAVSGGRDSVLLAHLFKKNNFSFGIAHCNFSLRNQESEADEHFVFALAKAFQVPFFSTKFQTKEYAQAHQVSIQMAARDLRYQWLEKIRATCGFDYVALAHHQNDTIETILLNLTRGTGIAGLHGIAPKRGKFIRPMLCFTRNEVDELISQLKIDYREDSSNQTTKYARNKIRLEIIPTLKQINPKLEETFEANRKRFAELEILLKNQLQTLEQALFKKEKANEIRIEIASLKKLNPQITLLFGLFNPFGFTEATLQDLSKSWDKHAGKYFESATHSLYLDRKYLFLIKKNQTLEEDEIIIQENSGQLVALKWKNIVLEACKYSAAQTQIKKASLASQLAYEHLEFPLKIRSWQLKDFFYPLGMSGKRKKISDFLIEKKIPLSHKKEIPILINGNGAILAVLGYRIDDRYKITESTKHVFEIRIK